MSVPLGQSATSPRAVEGNRAKSMTMAGGGPPRPPIAAGSATPPPPPTASPAGRPKSVVVPGANVNTLKMKAIFEGGPSSSPSPSTPSSFTPSPLLSTGSSSSLTFPPPSPSKPMPSHSAPSPSPSPSPSSTSTASTPTGAPVNRMKSFFEDRARQEQEALRGGNEARRQELAKKQEEKVMKDRVEREFFETEENYFKSLDIVVEVYVKPLRGEAKMISQQDMDTIFSNIETIHQIHQRLYLDLKPLFSPEADTSTQPEDGAQPKVHSATKLDSKTQRSLGDLLRAFIPFFKMYTVYINSFDNANKRVSDLQNSSKKFAQFLTDCKDRPECKKLDLVSFLIMPIQRLPRYELLLRDILRHTSDASEHAKIEQVFNTVAEVNKHVNSEKGASILRARLYKLKAAVKHRVDIFSRPDRRLVREGDVGVRKVEQASRLVDLNLPLVGKNLSSERRQTVVGLDKDFLAPKKDFKTVYFFLFDDFLLQVVKKSKSDKYTFRSMHNLLHVNVILVQQGVPAVDRVRSSQELAVTPSGLGSTSPFAGSGSHPLPTRSLSLKTVGRPKSSQDLTIEGMQNGDAASNGDDNEGEAGGASVIQESEGEVVDDPDAELMLLLVDHKTKEKIHIKFKSRHEKEDWMELILKGKEEMTKLGLEGPKDLKEEAVAEKKAKEEKEKEEKELKRAQHEKEKKEKEAKMAQLQAQKEKENAMYKYDHMFKGVILPSLNPQLKEQTEEVCGSLVAVLADKDISELGAKMPFRLRTVRARNRIVKLQLWLQKPNDTPSGIPESALRGGLHTLIVAYDATSAESLETARAWIAEIKKLNPPVVGTLLAFHPAQSTTEGEAVSSEAGQQAASEEGYVFFDAGRVAAADEDALDASFETVVERILDMKEGSCTSPSSGGPDNDQRRNVDVLELDLGKGDKKKEGKLKGILGIGKKLSRKTSNAGSSGSGGSPSGGKKESRG